MTQKRGFKDDIIRLRSEGKSFNEIASTLGCSKTIVSYHLNDKTQRRMKNQIKSVHPFQTKLYRFNRTDGGPKNIAYERKRKKTVNDRLLAKIQTFHRQGGAGTMCDKKSFTIQDIINRFGENPKCYLTGVDINIYDTHTYEFDHIIPRSRGGQNTLDNLGIASKKANQSKNNMTPDELLNLCKLILENHGYSVSK